MQVLPEVYVTSLKFEQLKFTPTGCPSADKTPTISHSSCAITGCDH